MELERSGGVDVGDDGGGDHVAMLFEAMPQRGVEEAQHLVARGGVDGAHSVVLGESQGAGRIAKGRWDWRHGRIWRRMWNRIWKG